MYTYENAEDLAQDIISEILNLPAKEVVKVERKPSAIDDSKELSGFYTWLIQENKVAPSTARTYCYRLYRFNPDKNVAQTNTVLNYLEKYGEVVDSEDFERLQQFCRVQR